MPDIFKKDCKVTVIEYGTHAPDFTIQQLKNHIASLFSRILKKSRIERLLYDLNDL